MIRTRAVATSDQDPVHAGHRPARRESRQAGVSQAGRGAQAASMLSHHVQECSPSAFATALEPWLSEDPIPYALICTVAQREGAWCASVHAGDRLIAACARTPGWPAVLAVFTGYAAQADTRAGLQEPLQ